MKKDQVKAQKPKLDLVVADGGLVGKYFHSFTSQDKLCWQGQIVGMPHPDYVLVELFDWMVGSANGGKLVPLSDVANNWNIYETAEEMRNAGDNHPSWKSVGGTQVTAAGDCYQTT